MVIGAVPLFHALPVWAVTLERTFGWSRTSLAVTLTITRMVGFAGPLFGYITDRIGPRRTVLTGLCILSSGTVLFALTPNLFVLYIAFLVMAVGQSLCGTIPLVVMISSWFVRRRATAIAFLLLTPSLGGVILVPAIAWTTDPDHGGTGWRLVVLVLAGLTLITIIPVFALLRNRPEDMGRLPHGVPPAAQSASFSIGRTLRAPAFWRITLGDALASMAIVATMFFLVSLMSDKGFSLVNSGSVVTAYTGAGMLFNPVGGYLGDRMSKRSTLALFALAQAVGIIGLAFANSLTIFIAFSLVAGAGYGGRGVLAIAIFPDYFGTASLGKILGFSGIFATVFLLFTAPITGLMIDMWGTYIIPIVVLAGLSLLAAYLFQSAHPPQPSDLRQSEASTP